MDGLQKLRVPGPAWIALILALIGWLQGDWFAAEPWAAGVVLILATVAKLLQMYVFTERPPETRSAAGRYDGSRLFEFLWG